MLTFALMTEKIIILDFGSQYTQLIARAVREANVYCEILPYHKSFDLSPDIKGIILSGSPSSVNDEKAPLTDVRKWAEQRPVLGICYGAQLTAKQFGGRVERSEKREYGRAHLNISNSSCGIFRDVPENSQVWMSHGDSILELPSDFDIVATTNSIPVAAFQVTNLPNPLFGLQFHPEVYHSEKGKTILRNFLVDICGCAQDWTPAHFITDTVNALKQQIGNKKVIMALSGGVDSTVAATLISKAIGENLFGIFVDNGVLRKDEFNQVLETYKLLNLNVKGVDAKEHFYTKLAGKSAQCTAQAVAGIDFGADGGQQVALALVFRFIGQCGKGAFHRQAAAHQASELACPDRALAVAEGAALRADVALPPGLIGWRAVLCGTEDLHLQRHQPLGAQQTARGFGAVGLQRSLAGLAVGLQGFKAVGRHGASDSSTEVDHTRLSTPGGTSRVCDRVHRADDLAAVHLCIPGPLRLPALAQRDGAVCASPAAALVDGAVGGQLVRGAPHVGAGPGDRLTQQQGAVVGQCLPVGDAGRDGRACAPVEQVLRDHQPCAPVRPAQVVDRGFASQRLATGLQQFGWRVFLQVHHAGRQGCTPQARVEPVVGEGVVGPDLAKAVPCGPIHRAHPPAAIAQADDGARRQRAHLPQIVRLEPQTQAPGQWVGGCGGRGRAGLLPPDGGCDRTREADAQALAQGGHRQSLVTRSSSAAVVMPPSTRRWPSSRMSTMPWASAVARSSASGARLWICARIASLATSSSKMPVRPA